MTFPVVATTNTSVTATENNTHTVNLPASIASGDLLLMFFHANQGNDADITSITGWTEIADVLGTTATRFFAFRKTATGSEGATVSVTTTADAVAAHQTYRITGWTGTPEVTTAEGTSTTPDPPNLTPSWGAKDTLWLAVAGAAATSITSTPTNYTNAVDSSTGTGGLSALTRSSRRELNATSDNPSAYGTTGSVTDWVTFTIAIEPLVSGAADQRTFEGNMVHAAGYGFRSRLLATG